MGNDRLAADHSLTMTTRQKLNAGGHHHEGDFPSEFHACSHTFIGHVLDTSSGFLSPLRGGQARRNKLLVIWEPLVIAAPLAGLLLAPLRCAAPCRSQARATWQPLRYPRLSQVASYLRSVALSIFGRPSFTPWATARLSPVLIRWRIIVRSNSVNAPDCSL